MQSERWFFSLMIAILLTVFVMAVGCRSVPVSVSADSGDIVSRVSVIESSVSRSSAESHVKELVVEQSTAIKSSAKSLTAWGDEGWRSAESWKTAYENLKADWWTNYFGQRVKVWLYWIVGIYIGLSVLTILLSVFVSPSAPLVKFFVRFLPFANWIRWIDSLFSRR
ncbi:MAG: hypothetical protein KatS3mg104_3067 [Phycisphaerae bacterium]|nr:MAG: hypothetical protein KatS3mg104_3067 [Phycisphaerae bacterium]